MGGSRCAAWAAGAVIDLSPTPSVRWKAVTVRNDWRFGPQGSADPPQLCRESAPREHGSDPNLPRSIRSIDDERFTTIDELARKAHEVGARRNGQRMGRSVDVHPMTVGNVLLVDLPGIR